jgi:hypothetical protein
MRPSCSSPHLLSDPDGPEAHPLQFPAASTLASREIRCVNPLIRSPQLRPLPAMLPSPSADQNQLASPVPPLWFCTTSTACSAGKFRACCIPVPEGVRRVSVPQPPLATASSEEDPLASGRPQPFPLRPSHPSKKSPRPQPRRITATLATSSLDRHRPSEQARRSGDDLRPRGLAPLSGP